jgi:hypothetical protein
MCSSSPASSAVHWSLLLTFTLLLGAEDCAAVARRANG